MPLRLQSTIQTQSACKYAISGLFWGSFWNGYSFLITKANSKKMVSLACKCLAEHYSAKKMSKAHDSLLIVVLETKSLGSGIPNFGHFVIKMHFGLQIWAQISDKSGLSQLNQPQCPLQGRAILQTNDKKWHVSWFISSQSDRIWSGPFLQSKIFSEFWPLKYRIVPFWLYSYADSVTQYETKFTVFSS